MYDIIGDVHGHHTTLVSLLTKLGYKHDGISYIHPTRKAIFVGDLVDKGSTVRQVLETVKPMVDRGAAQVILGNHEYYLICYTIKGPNGSYLRKHSPKNTRQVGASLHSFKADKASLFTYVEWLRTLPFYIEFDNLRIVHACWSQQAIDYLKKNSITNLSSDKVLFESVNPKSELFNAVRTLIEGVKITLPFKIMNSEKGEYTNEIKSKWWISPVNQTYKAIAVKNAFDVPDVPIPPQFIKYELEYKLSEKPLFFGHYCLHDTPGLIHKNLCCVDFCIVKRGILTAYRWNGENELDPHNIVLFKNRRRRIVRWIKNMLP
jgi:hypothetical protein